MTEEDMRERAAKIVEGANIQALVIGGCWPAYEERARALEEAIVKAMRDAAREGLGWEESIPG